MSAPLLIAGAGRAARFTREIAEACGRRVLGFLDDFQVGAEVEGTRVLGGLDYPLRAAGEFELALAVGDIACRRRLLNQWREAGLPLATLVHPLAVVSPRASLETGAIVNAFSMLYPGSRLGLAVMIEDQCSVGVDVVLEDNVVLAPGVVLAAQASVGRDGFLGARAVVNPETRVGPGCLIGAGAVVAASLPAGVVAAGVPARVLKPSPHTVADESRRRGQEPAGAADNLDTTIACPGGGGTAGG